MPSEAQAKLSWRTTASAMTSALVKKSTAQREFLSFKSRQLVMCLLFGVSGARFSSFAD